MRDGEGLGTPTPGMVEERAYEIARMDGRNQPNDLDREKARADLTGKPDPLQSTETKEDPGRDWEMPLVSSGEQVPTVPPDDETRVQEVLAEQGVEEADYDQRKASSNEHPPEE